MNRSDSLAALVARIHDAIAQAGGWLPFDRYMELALYAPGLGYYAAAPGVLGRWGGDSDFVTAPELSPLFGATLARQLADVGRAQGLDRVVEFGAGSGRLACDMLAAWSRSDWMPREYAIVEVSAAMRARQQEAVAALPAEVGARVTWWDRLPARFDALVVGNEVLDAMPVRLLVRTPQGWSERGVIATGDDARPFAWSDRPGATAPRAMPAWRSWATPARRASCSMPVCSTSSATPCPPWATASPRPLTGPGLRSPRGCRSW